MVTAIALPVHELLTVHDNGNKAYGFGLVFYPDVNGADGVMRTEGNDAKPEWIITGPWNAKLPRHAKGEGVTITHLEIKRDKVIVNKTYVYDRVGFIALKFDGAVLEEEMALTAKDAAALMHTAAMSDTNIRVRNNKVASRDAHQRRVTYASKASIGNSGGK